MFENYVDIQALAYDWNICLLDDRQVFMQGQGDRDLQKLINFVESISLFNYDHVRRKEHCQQCSILFVFVSFSFFCVLFLDHKHSHIFHGKKQNSFMHCMIN